MRSGLGVTCPACGSANGERCTAAIVGSDERQALSAAHPVRVWRDTCRLPDNIDLKPMTPDCWLLYAPGRRYLGRLEKTGVLRAWTPFGADGRALPHRGAADLQELVVVIFRAYVETTKAAS